MATCLECPCPDRLHTWSCLSICGCICSISVQKWNDDGCIFVYFCSESEVTWNSVEVNNNRTRAPLIVLQLERSTIQSNPTRLRDQKCECCACYSSLVSKLTQLLTSVSSLCFWSRLLIPPGRLRHQDAIHVQCCHRAVIGLFPPWNQNEGEYFASCRLFNLLDFQLPTNYIYYLCWMCRRMAKWSILPRSLSHPKMIV